MVEQPQVLAQMLAFESTRVPLFWPLLALGAVLIAFGLIKRRTFVAAGGAVLGALALVAGTGFTVAAPVVYLAGFTALLWFVLGFTVIGRRLSAVGGNPEAARLSGIRSEERRVGKAGVRPLSTRW